MKHASKYYLINTLEVIAGLSTGWYIADSIQAVSTIKEAIPNIIVGVVLFMIVTAITSQLLKRE